MTPTSFVDVTRWTRTHTNRLLFDAGIAIYDQEYTELYQPEVTGQTDKVWDLNAIRNSKVYNVVDNTNSQNTVAWNAPADHFSLLRTFSGSASYVTGSHSMKFGAAVTNGDWRLVSVYTGDVQPITFNAGVPVSVRLQLPPDQRNGIKADTGIFAQDRWTMGRATLNLGVRYDQFIGETQAEDLLAGRFNAAQHFDDVRGRQEQQQERLHRHGPELEGHLAACRRGVRRLRRRQDRGQGELRPLRHRRADRHGRREQPDHRARTHGHASLDRHRQERFAV